MALFVSTFINRVDRKGRVSVPASFRTILTKQSFQGIVVYPSFITDCIEGCGMDFLEDLAASAAATFNVFSTQQTDFNTLVFQKCRQLPWDPEGRVMLPEDILDHARITELAAFVGNSHTFQIWEPEALKAHQAEATVRVRENPPQLMLRSTRGPGVQ